MALLVTLVLTFLLPTTSLAASKDPVWDDYYDREGPPKKDDIAHAVAVSGSKVFVAGETEAAAGPDFSVRAYNTADGEVLWENQCSTLYPYGHHEAKAIAAKGGRVFVAGITGSAAGRVFSVRAFDVKTGAFLWGDYYDGDSSVDHDNEAYGVAIAGSRVIVVGADLAFSARAFEK